MSRTTLQPHACGRCECAIAPFRSALDGSQCACQEPSSPAPVPDDDLCFYIKDIPSAEVAIDLEAQGTGLDCISGLAEDIGKVESRLAFLTGFVDDDALAGAIVGALGVRATEMRQQIPALRQAILDIPLMGGSDRSGS